MTGSGISVGPCNVRRAGIGFPTRSVDVPAICRRIFLLWRRRELKRTRGGRPTRLSSNRARSGGGVLGAGSTGSTLATTVHVDDRPIAPAPEPSRSPCCQLAQSPSFHPHSDVASCNCSASQLPTSRACRTPGLSSHTPQACASWNGASNHSAESSVVDGASSAATRHFPPN
jgi:hypothetical protein